MIVHEEHGMQTLAEHEITVVVLDGVDGSAPGEVTLVIAEDGSWRRV